MVRLLAMAAFRGEVTIWIVAVYEVVIVIIDAVVASELTWKGRCVTCRRRDAVNVIAVDHHVLVVVDSVGAADLTVRRFGRPATRRSHGYRHSGRDDERSRSR